MQANDILKACCGVDELGAGKASVGLFHEVWNKDTNIKPQTVNNYNIQGPEIQINDLGDFWQVNIKFKTELDSKLQILWRYINNVNEYNQKFDYENRKEEIPVLVMNISPNEYNGEYYLLGINPIMIFPTADTLGDKALTISFIFDSDKLDAFSTAEEAQ